MQRPVVAVHILWQACNGDDVGKDKTILALAATEGPYSGVYGHKTSLETASQIPIHAV